MNINPKLLALLLIFAGCGRRAPNPPSPLTLAGTWVCEINTPRTNYFKSTLTVNPRGEYICFITIERSNGSDFFQAEGNWQVKDGFLIDTMTKHSSTNFQKPVVERAQIIRSNQNELVLKFEDHNFESTMRRQR